MWIFGFFHVYGDGYRNERGAPSKGVLLQGCMPVKATEMGFIEAFYSLKESKRFQKKTILARSLLFPTLIMCGYIDIGGVSG